MGVESIEAGRIQVEPITEDLVGKPWGRGPKMFSTAHSADIGSPRKLGLYSLHVGDIELGVVGNKDSIGTRVNLHCAGELSDRLKLNWGSNNLLVRNMVDGSSLRGTRPARIHIGLEKDGAIIGGEFHQAILDRIGSSGFGVKHN